MFASLALAASAASCSTAGPTAPPDPGGYGAGAPSAGSASHAGNGGMHGGVSGGGGSSGAVVQAGSGGTSSASGGTGTGSGGTGGSGAVGGGAGASTGGGSGTGSSSGGMSSGGMSGGTGFGFGGRVGTGGSGGANNAGRGSGGMSSGGMSSGGSAGGGGFGANGGVAPPPDISGGSNGWASRYWDCCKPACGWSSHTNGRAPAKSCDQQDNPISDPNAKSACDSGGGQAFMCWSGVPWAVGDKLSYGYAAASGNNFVCGRCYHLQFTGSSHNGGSASASRTDALNGKHMIVQVLNDGGVGSDQLDLLIPGGGVGMLNACDTQWPNQDLGATYGGFLASCNGDLNCTKQKCTTVFAGKQDLLDGCNWFLGWFGGADNPNFTMQQIACPSDITNKSGLSDSG